MAPTSTIMLHLCPRVRVWGMYWHAKRIKAEHINQRPTDKVRTTKDSLSGLRLTNI